MTNPLQDDVTQLLHRAGDGDVEAAERLAPLVYDELHALAAAHMRRERSDHTLQATGLVHEAWVRLIDEARVDWESRSAFFAISSRAMRQVLVRHALTRGRKKRGGDAKREAFEVAIACLADRTLAAPEFLDLHEALERLETVEPRAARIIDLRFFGGLTIREAAEVTGLSPATVEADFRTARAWLRAALAERRSEKPPG